MTLRRLAMAAALVAFGRTMPAQDWQNRSVVGSAAATLDATFARLHNESFPLQTSVVVNASYAPFVTSHWQVVFAPGFGMNSSQLGHYFAGSAAVAANFFPGDASSSSPFVGAFFSANAASHQPGYAAWGVQAGWLRFLSPELALRTEIRYRRYETAQPVHQSDVFVTFDSYLFGRARPRPRALPALGTVDMSALADLVFDPTQSLTMNLSAGPFLTRWLQVGGLSDFLFLFDENVSQHALEAFVRGYVPLSSRAAPFAELYTGRENLQFGTSTRGSHGARLGVRSYLAPGLALDLGWEWRNFGDLEPELRQLRVRLVQQIRVGFGS